VTRYGRTAAVTVHEHQCLWYGAFRSQPVRVLVVREPRRPALALLTTDTATPAAQLIARYAARWSIEVAFFEAKHVTGAGEARNRTPLAVERTAPFGMLTQTLSILWYQLAGHSPAVVAEHRSRAALVYDQNPSQLPRHADQTPPRTHRRPISSRPTRRPHSRTNPHHPPGLGQHRRLIAKREFAE
jgi:hypothetical protein